MLAHLGTAHDLYQFVQRARAAPAVELAAEAFILELTETMAYVLVGVFLLIALLLYTVWG